MLSRRCLLKTLAMTGGTVAFDKTLAVAACRNTRRSYCGTIHTKPPTTTFPDTKLWNQTTPHMTEQDVLAILGPPVERESPRHTTEEEGIHLYRWNYGRLPIDSPQVPARFSYDLYFHDGQLQLKEQPFEVHDPSLLNNPAPSLPRIIYPKDSRVFDHYPRITDFRWHPAIGQYPMTYLIQVYLCDRPPYRNDNGVNPESHLMCISTRVDIPYFCAPLAGKQSFWWRVKAQNQHGESDWTAPALFSFSV